MFNWLLEIYVNGFNIESNAFEKMNLFRKKRLFAAWKSAMPRLKKENRKVRRQNRKLVQTFRKIILCSKVFIGIRKLQRRK